MHKLKYAAIQGAIIFSKNLRKNLASILTIATLLFFYLAVFSVNYSASKAIDKVSDIKTIRIFLEEGVSQKEMLKKLSNLQMPASYKSYTKSDAKQRVLRLVPGARNIQKLPDNLFPEFIEMKIADYAAVNGLVLETAYKIEKIGGVKTVEYGKRVGEKLGKIKRTSVLFMLFISVLTGLSSAIIIFNTIRLSLFRSKRKIMIYKLVGATRMFVTSPYLFSSLIEASFAYVIAIFANQLFIKGVETYLLKDSYFLLFTPPAIIYILFYLLLTFTALFSALFCVLSFLRRLRSLNEA
ncbi:MAG: hypothetical protein C0603_04005 [Denitrovibrio sp.]|nr:MAG: hypothetical protein C0603_04005 [Denitrovibrio sp.]